MGNTPALQLLEWDDYPEMKIHRCRVRFEKNITFSGLLDAGDARKAHSAVQECVPRMNARKTTPRSQSQLNKKRNFYSYKQVDST